MRRGVKKGGVGVWGCGGRLVLFTILDFELE